MSTLAPNRAIATPHGTYLVQGLDRFAVGGDIDAEVRTAVTAHHARFGATPKAVIWDDAVLNFRPLNGRFGLNRVFIPPHDAYVAAALDSTGRAAIRVDVVPAGGLQTSDVLGELAWPDEVAHAPELARLIGWPDSAPLRDVPPARPTRRAASVSVVINYRDKADTTVAALHHLRRQRLAATLEVILVDNQSIASERRAVEEAAMRLFGAGSVRHLGFDEAFNHSRQCNQAAELARGDVLLMLSNDCSLLDSDTLQTLADWALEPGIGAVGPRLVGDDGEVACAGMAIAPRLVGATEPHVHEAEVAYLSRMVRRSNGASFACAAIARATWDRLGGADTSRFTIDYNDADFCLRATQAGFANLYVGTVSAHHQAGLADVRTREGAEALHGELAAKHGLERMPRLNPAALPIKNYPPFTVPEATVLCDHVRLYRRALDMRDRGETLAEPTAAAFERLFDTARKRDDVSEGRDARIDQAIREVSSAFLATAPTGQVPDRYRRSFEQLAKAYAMLTAMQARPVDPILFPAEAFAEQLLARQAAPQAAALPSDEFISHADPITETAKHRLLIFADAFGASQRILFVEALGNARRRGEAAVTIVTEENLHNLRSLRGPDAQGAWLADLMAATRPTAIVYSRFADAEGHRAIEAAAATLDAPRLCHIDDDFFSLPAVMGVGRYREGRHPRRIHALSAIAAECDLLLASTPLLAERLGGLFGTGKIGLCPMHEGGEPAPRQPPHDPPILGYFGSATHDRDLEMVAPALRRLKAERPTLRIQIVGSVARGTAAAGLGDLIERSAELEPDYARFRARMFDWRWTVGLAPLAAHPFNAAKTPIKWTEYAVAGIPVVASRTDPYLELGREGALLLAGTDEWEGRMAALLDNPPRREDLIRTSDRLLAGFDGWMRMERRLLGLIGRAADRRRILARAE